MKLYSKLTQVVERRKRALVRLEEQLKRNQQAILEDKKFNLTARKHEVRERLGFLYEGDIVRINKEIETLKQRI